MSKNKQLTIGLFGFGVVGEGIYKVLEQTPTLNATIKKICIKDPSKKRNAPESLFTIDANELLNDDKINVIVELIDDSVAAFEIVSTALKKKKAVVSANKKLVAEKQEELLLLQKKHDVPFLYEAAVCGSIPVIRNLEEYFDNDLLKSFTGIVNGSTNYILTKMNDEDISYEQALKQAQELGFAESDPSLDVEGKDAVNKLAIILNHAYGIVTKTANILHKGITSLSPYDTTYATEKGYAIKLIARAGIIENGKIGAFVLPSFVDHSNKLYSVKNEYNGVLIGSKLADEQFFYGKGAGRYPTSSAVLSDISALRYDYRYEYKKGASAGVAYELTNNFYIRIFVSFNPKNKINKNDFAQIEESFHSREKISITGIISLYDLQQAEWFYNKDVSIIFISEAPEFSIERKVSFKKELLKVF